MCSTVQLLCVCGGGFCLRVIIEFHLYDCTRSFSQIVLQLTTPPSADYILSVLTSFRTPPHTALFKSYSLVSGYVTAWLRHFWMVLDVCVTCIKHTGVDFKHCFRLWSSQSRQTGALVRTAVYRNYLQMVKLWICCELSSGVLQSEWNEPVRFPLTNVCHNFIIVIILTFWTIK